VDEVTAERLFEREWATTLLERCLTRLGEEFAAAGKAPEFEALKGSLAGGEAARPFAEIAAELGCSAEAARQTAHRFRRRYRQVLRAEVAETVADPRDVDEEIRGLFAIMGG
jgi:RNA polymerase sigma-70 factor (ECF subfamily)